MDKREFRKRKSKISKEISKHRAEHSVRDAKFKAAAVKFRTPSYLEGKKG